MTRKAVLLSMILATLLIATAPAAAQGGAETQMMDSAGATARPAGTEPPARPPGWRLPDYALEKDGTVIIDGDVVTECRSFALGFEQGYDSAGNQEQARRVLEECRRAGFTSSRGDMTYSNSKVIVDADGTDSLPETGGASPALLAAGLLLVALSLTVYRRE